MHWKKSYILHCNHRQFVVDAINRGVKTNFSSLQLFDRVWTMVYNNVTYFAMTVYPRIYLARWSYAPTPGRYPNTPAWRHIDVLTHRNHSTKKMGAKIHKTPSYVHLKWKYNIRLPPKERPSRAKAARVQVVNMSWWIYNLTGARFGSWIEQCAIYCVDSGSWFFASFHYLHFHPLLWCLICTFEIPYRVIVVQ